MDLQKVYQEKLTTAQEAVKVVKSGDWLDWGWCTGTPDALDKALAARMPELHDIKIRGGILLKVPEIFKVENAPEHFCWNSWHMSGIERKAIAQGIAYYGPIRYSELPRYYMDLDCPSDIVMIQVAPMDSRGYFSFGPNASHLEAVCKRAKTIIVEVNEKMPYCWGGDASAVHITKVDMIVEGENPDILEMKGSDVMTDVDKKVAEYILEEIPNGACLQLGIGGMPNAVGKLIAESDLKDLGVHTEMYGCLRGDGKSRKDQRQQEKYRYQQTGLCVCGG